METSLIEKLNQNIQKLSEQMERNRIEEYTSMMVRPWKFFLVNFLAGVARGFGLALGMTLVVAVVVYLLSQVLIHFIDVPFIGEYIAQIVAFVNEALKNKVVQ